MSQNSTELKLKRGVDFIGVTCVFYCHDGKGNILLHKRSDKCRDEKGRWDCGGGSLKVGEDPAEAVAREIKEEYCVEADDIQLVTVTNVLRTRRDGVQTHWIALLHTAKVDPDKVKIGEPTEMDDIGWFAPDKFPDPMHSCAPDHFGKVRNHIPGCDSK